MKKLFVASAAAALMLTAGVCVQFTDQAPVMVDNRTLVPARAVFEKAGAEVSWDQPTQTATFKRGSDVVTIKYNDSFLYKNGTPVALDVPAQIIPYDDPGKGDIRGYGFRCDLEWSTAECFGVDKRQAV